MLATFPQGNFQIKEDAKRSKERDAGTSESLDAARSEVARLRSELDAVSAKLRDACGAKNRLQSDVESLRASTTGLSARSAEAEAKLEGERAASREGGESCDELPF